MIENKCVDVGTVSCPCVLAMSGDCLVCSRLAGSDKCDCSWSGVCVYNEFMQNDCVLRDIRRNMIMPVRRKKYYSDDLLVIELEVPAGFALQAVQPGTFIFVKPEGESNFYNMPVSIMRVDEMTETIHLAIKIISGKSKKIAEAEDYLEVRGIYRNGLLGKGTQFLERDRRSGARWLVITKGIGFAPAVKLLEWAGSKVNVDLMIDDDKITSEFINDYSEEFKHKGTVTISKINLQKQLDLFDCNMADEYNRVVILASNFFIKEIIAKMGERNSKLVHCNNFNMCCGEGICGACCYTNSAGKVYKTCKCRL